MREQKHKGTKADDFQNFPSFLCFYEFPVTLNHPTNTSTPQTMRVTVTKDNNNEVMIHPHDSPLPGTIAHFHSLNNHLHRVLRSPALLLFLPSLSLLSLQLLPPEIPLSMSQSCHPLRSPSQSAASHISNHQEHKKVAISTEFPRRICELARR